MEVELDATKQQTSASSGGDAVMVNVELGNKNNNNKDQTEDKESKHANNNNNNNNGKVEQTLIPIEQRPPYRPHQGSHRQYLRDMILGVNDGLVSMFLLILGIGGGGLSSKDILLAGIAGTIAGAISMALGEYMATKSQSEVYDGDLELEKEHFKYYREVELEQVREVFTDLGFKGQQLEDAVTTIDSNDESLLKIMKAFEFGQNDADQRHPAIAMLMSGGLFFAGAFPTFIPFAFTSDVTIGLIVSTILSLIAMFAVGAFKTIMTRGDWWKGGFENFIFGAAAAGLTYGVGVAYEKIRG